MPSWKSMQQDYNATQKYGNNLLVVDGLNLCFRYQKETKSFALSFVNTIISLAKSYSCNSVIVLGDKGKSIYRKEIYPEYKGNRDEKYANQTEEEKEAAKQFFAFYDEALEDSRKHFPTFVKKGVEADDLAGVIVSELADKFDTVWLVSTDGDWDTLLTDNVKRFSYKTRKEYTVENMYDNHGCDTVEQFIGLKALQGDLGDNIRGVEGIGEKRGYTLLSKHGSISELLDSLPLEGKQMFVKNLNNSEELIERNIKLVDLPSYCYEAVQAAGYLEEFLNDINKIGEKS